MAGDARARSQPSALAGGLGCTRDIAPSPRRGGDITRLAGRQRIGTRARALVTSCFGSALPCQAQVRSVGVPCGGAWHGKGAGGQAATSDLLASVSGMVADWSLWGPVAGCGYLWHGVKAGSLIRWRAGGHGGCFHIWHPAL